MNKITVKDVLTASGRYPQRETHPECTQEVKDNAQIMCDKVNACLDEIGYTGKRDVSSGFRPANVNASTKGAAAKSHHLIANAVDLFDPKGEIDQLCMDNQDILAKHGLFLEHPESTPNWCHLQRFAPRSGNRVFKVK